MSETPMMQIHLRYFAAIRERVGRDQETLDLPITASIGTARAALNALHPALAPILRQCLAARNRVFADDATMLVDGDELVFIPPMAGGVYSASSSPA